MWKSFEETAGTLGYPFIGGATIRGEGIRREDYNIENFYVQMKENLKDPLEIEIANQTIERLERDIEALKKIQEKTHKYVTQGGNNSLEGIAENTPPDGGDFDIKFWRDAMGGLPALSYRDESGKWVQETKTLAEQIFCAFREILRRGERLEEKMGTSEAPERHTGSKLLLKNGERSPKVIPVSVVGTTTQSRSLHPWVYAEKAGALTATRKKNFDEVVEMVSAKSVDDSTRGTWSDMAARFAGLTALSLTEITNESGSQDINRTSGSKLPGSPSGLKLLHRISIGTAAPYIYKDTYNGAFNNTTLPGNIFGIVKGYVMPYFDFYGYDGMTWTQRFRSSPDTVKTFADPTFRWDLFPDNPSAAYGNHIKTMTSVAKFDLEKRSSMDPNSSGTINYRQNEPTKANAEYFDNWTTYIKYAHKYAGQTDAMPFMACQPPSREEKARYADGIPFIDEINPTGQYIRIRVVDENGNDTSGHFESTMKGTFKTSPDYSTRVNQWWYTSPPELTRWMTMADMNKKVIDINTAVVPTQMRRRSDGSVINYPQKTMTIKVRRDAPTVEDVNVAAAKGETARGSLGIYPDLLIKRELIAKGHHIFWYGGSTIADLTRDKLTLHGMFFANDFVTRHRNRVDKGPLESSLTTASVFLERLRKGDPTIDSSFLTMEVPDIQQINVFDGETLLELYYLVGLQIKAEDFTKPTEAIFSNLSGSK
ncbi:hypothetical protein LRY64_04890 [Candidatus Woesebacteria bacterium]|nr:hypothetical protein [Candidatus Woesebacteria bacterium]